MKTATRAFLIVALAAGGGSARAESPVTGSGESFQINGYTSFEFEKMVGDEGEGDPNGSFDADLFDVVLNWRASEHLRVAADMTWEHGAASEDGRGNVALEYGWAEYSVGDFFRVRAGKMFTPFGIYNEIHTAKPATLTVKEPFSTNRTDKWGTAARLYPRWQVGVGFFGNGASGIGDWDYALTVSNGEQFVFEGGDLETTGNPFEEDNNKEKAITARVRLATVGNLEFGISGYYDSVRLVDGAGDPIAGSLQQTAYGFSVKWSNPEPSIGVELEYVGGDFNPSSALVDATGLDTATSKGGSAMVFWHATEKLTPYVRYEYLNLDDDIDADATSLILAGLNVKVGDGLVIKAEGDYTMAQKNASYGDGVNGLDFFEVKIAAVVGF